MSEGPGRNGNGRGSGRATYCNDLTKEQKSDRLDVVPAWGVGTLEDAVLDAFDRLMALPVDVRMNLVAAVEAAAKIESLEQRSPGATA